MIIICHNFTDSGVFFREIGKFVFQEYRFDLAFINPVSIIFFKVFP